MTTWMLIFLSCTHVGGCTIEGKAFQTREECVQAMTIPESHSWTGTFFPAHLDPHSICLPVSGTPVFRPKD
jgi:hypothetical protein